MKEQELSILLVDDDEDDAVLIQSMLSEIQRAHFTLQWASTYDQGLTKLNGGEWSAILVDYDLGLKNGLEFIREVSPRVGSTPMIMVTGRGRHEVDVEAMQAGAADYVSKDELNAPFLERTIRYAIERKRVEEELERRVRERTHEIQLLLDQTPAMVWVTNQELQISSALGKRLATPWKRTELLVGKSIQQVFGSLDSQQEAKIVTAHEQALEGASTSLEIELGQVILNAYVEPFRDSDRKIIGCIGIAFDISARRQAESAQRTSLALFEGLFEASPDGILLVLADGTIQRANRQVETMFGYRREEIEGQPVEMLIPQRYHHQHVQDREAYTHSPRMRSMGHGLDLSGLHKENNEFPIDVTLSPLRVNEQAYVICVIRALDPHGNNSADWPGGRPPGWNENTARGGNP